METSSRNSLTNVSGGLPIVPTRLPKTGFIKMTWLLEGVRSQPYIVPDAELRQQIRNCGNTMIFSGPIQNPVLGACIASAELHLSGEIHAMQTELKDLVAYCFGS